MMMIIIIMISFQDGLQTLKRDDHHRWSWQTCAKKSEGLGRVGFYFSKFEAPLDNFTSSALLAILESCSPGMPGRGLLAWGLAGLRVFLWALLESLHIL